MKKHSNSIYRYSFKIGPLLLAIGWLGGSTMTTALAQTTPDQTSPATTPGPAQVKYIPQRLDDIAWENDRIAHRIYGPALEKKSFTGSGIDVWVKSTRNYIIDEWYKRGDYHLDRGDGLDFYDVGHSRGCGGLGIWDGTQLYTSGHWVSYEIKDTGPQRAVWTLKYAPWNIQGGKQVSEDRTMSLEPGTNLTRLESTLTSDLPELTVGIGIAKRKGPGGDLDQDKEKGIMCYWQPPDPVHGVIGCAVIVNPADVVGFAEDKLNYLILIKVKPGVPFVYRAGACWSKGLDFHTADDWKNYIIQQAAAK